VKKLDVRRLTRTTAVRIALRYALLYALLAGAAIGVLYWATGRYIDLQLHAGLREDFNLLLDRYRAEGLEALAAIIASRSESATDEGRFYLLVDKEQKKLAGNLRGLPPEDPLPLDGHVHIVWVEDDIIPIKVYDDAFWPVIGSELPDGSTLVVTRSVAEAEALNMYSFYALSALLAVIVLLALTMGVLTANTILRRIDGITHVTSDIMNGDLNRRMSVSDRGDEFDALSERLNAMLDRIEQLLKGMREVTDNVAHDLRSPLTRLRNRLEVTLLEKRDEAEYRQAMQEAIADAEGLVKTFNAILQISQAEAGTVRAEMAPVDLTQLIKDSADLYGPLAEEAGIRLEVRNGDEITVNGNRNLLSQAIGNLLDNAVKFTPAGGTITLTAKRSAEGAEVSVADTGPGIPSEDRKRVLQRYVRLDKARDTEGNGLGLSLVEAIARQHGATFTLEDNKPGLLASIRFLA
jgi:signal transduction histidine kinase